MTTTYCYDTEFLEDGRTIDLISIGIVCEDGREYYAVNSDCNFRLVKERDWLVRNVVSSLPVTRPAALKKYLDHPQNVFPRPPIDTVDLDFSHSSVKPKQVIANEVRDFLRNPVSIYRADELVARLAPKPKLWAYYGSYDHVALAQLWGSMAEFPEGIPMWTHDLMYLLEQRGLSAPPPPPGQHNALIDARWNMDLLRSLCPLEYPTRENQGTSS